MSEGIVSVLNSSATPVAFPGDFTGTYEPVKHFSSVTVAVVSDIVGSFNGLEFFWSDDGILDYVTDDLYTYNPFAGPFSLQTFTSLRRAAYFKVKFTNLSGPMGFFRLQTIFDYNPPQLQYRRVGDLLGYQDQAVPSKSTLWAFDTILQAFLPVSMSAAGNPKVAVVENTAALGKSYTNRSLAITTGGTAQQLMAANSSRTVVGVANPMHQDEIIWVSAVGTAAVRGQGSFPLFPGGMWAPPVPPTGAISVLAPTTGTRVTAWEAS